MPYYFSAGLQVLVLAALVFQNNLSAATKDKGYVRNSKTNSEIFCKRRCLKPSENVAIAQKNTGLVICRISQGCLYFLRISTHPLTVVDGILLSLEIQCQGLSEMAKTFCV